MRVGDKVVLLEHDHPIWAYESIGTLVEPYGAEGWLVDFGTLMTYYVDNRWIKLLVEV